MNRIFAGLKMTEIEYFEKRNRISKINKSKSIKNISDTGGTRMRSTAHRWAQRKRQNETTVYSKNKK